MSGSDSRSYSSSDGSNKSRVDYLHSIAAYDGEKLFFVSPVAHKIPKVNRLKLESPQSVLFQLEDLNASKSSKWHEPDAVLVSPRRSNAERAIRTNSGSSAPYRKAEKLQNPSYPAEPSSSKHFRPPSGRSHTEMNYSRSPKSADRDENPHSRRSSSHRSSSRTRRHDHRSGSRSRRYSKERDDRSERRPSSSGPRKESRRSRSPNRDGISDSRSRRDRYGYESSRTQSRDRNGESRSHSDRYGCESRRTRSRDKASESRNYRDRHGYDSTRTRSRDRASECHSSKSRSHPESSGGRSKSRSRTEMSLDQKMHGCRSTSRERNRSPRNPSSRGQRSSSRDGRSSRSSRGSSGIRGMKSPRVMKSPRDLRSPRVIMSETDKQLVQLSILSSKMTVPFVDCVKVIASVVPYESSNSEEMCAESVVQVKARASITLQTAWRCYLAVTKYQMKVSERNDKMQEAKRVEKRRMQEEELKRMQLLLEGIENERKADIKALKETMRAEKKALKELARRKFEKHVQMLDENKKAEQDALDALNQLELSELADESEKLKVTVSDLKSKIDEVEEENAKLQQANNDISDLFDSLNEFARKKAESKRKLTDAAQKLSQVYMPKIKADINQSILSCKVETKLKESHRACVYKISHCVQASDAYDHELYEDVMKTINECESFLGISVLSHNQSIDFLTSVENNAIDLKDRNASDDLVSSSCADENNSSPSGLGAIRSESDKSDWEVSWTDGQLFGSSAWETIDSSFGHGTSADDAWNTGRNLEEFLNKKFQLEDIDCQSHNSWQTEHEDRMACIR